MDHTAHILAKNREGTAGGEDLSRQGLTDIYREYSLRIYNFMRYRVRDSSTAEDLTSAVFERVILKYTLYDPEKGEFSVWIFTLARNVLRDHLRKEKRFTSLGLDALEEMPAREPSPGDILDSRWEQDRLMAALSRLKPREITALSLKYAGGLKNGEIAAVLGVSEKNAGVILVRGRKKLRAILADE